MIRDCLLTALCIRLLAGNTIFRVEFTKRTDGKLRVMRCRLNCRKGISGAGARYNALEHACLTVFDVGIHDWRNIPLEAIRSAKIRGVEYKF